MAAKNYSNVASTAALNAVAAAADLTWTVTGATGYPATPYWARIAPNTAAVEIVLVTAVVGTTWTVTRGQGGTSAANHSVGDSIEHIAPAVHFSDTEIHLDASTQVHGLAAGSAVVGTNDSQTIANKRVSPGSLRAAFSESTSPAWTAAVEVAADSAAVKDAVVVRNTAATSTRAAYLLEQSGVERYKVDMVGKVTVTPASGVGIENNGTLQQDGTSAFNADVTVTGALSSTTLASTGAATVGGTLGVTGTSTLGPVNSGNTSVTGTLGVSGTSTLAAVNAASVATTGAATVGTTLGVTGATTASTISASGLITASAGVRSYGSTLTDIAVVTALPGSGTTDQLLYLVTSTVTGLYRWSGAAWVSEDKLANRVMTGAGIQYGSITGTEVDIAKLGSTGVPIVINRTYRFVVDLFGATGTASTQYAIRVRRGSPLTGTLLAEWLWVPVVAGVDEHVHYERKWTAPTTNATDAFYVSVARTAGTGTGQVYGAGGTSLGIYVDHGSAPIQVP